MYKVVCRDYPHSRHCCVNFPFNSTPHEKHCTLCHCYVCDKPAPCWTWDQGNSMSDHCHASDKEEKWKKLRHSYKLYKMQMISPSIFDDAIPRLSNGRSTVMVSRSNQEGVDAVTCIPSNICQIAASQFRPSSLTDPISSRGPFSSASLSSHLTGQSRGILASSMSSIDPAGRSNSIGRKAVTSALSVSSHGGVHQFRSCSSTEHLNTDFQNTITGHSTSMHASSRRSVFSTSNQNPALETRPASMYSLYSCMPGHFARISQSGSVQTNSMSPTVQPGRYNQVSRREIESASLNINLDAAVQSGHHSSTDNVTDPSVMATRFHGSKISSLESNSMEATEPLNMLPSSNNEQNTLETCSVTQKVNQSADEGGSIDVLSRNSTSIQNVTAAADFNMLKEFLQDYYCDDDFFIHGTLFTDTFEKCLDQYNYSEMQPIIQGSSSEQLSSLCDSSTHVWQVASNIHISGGVSTVPTVSNLVQFLAVEQIPATSPVLSRATD